MITIERTVVDHTDNTIEVVVAYQVSTPFEERMDRKTVRIQQPLEQELRDQIIELVAEASGLDPSDVRVAEPPPATAPIQNRVPTAEPIDQP